MTDEKVILEFKYPWTMIPLENAGEWISAVAESLEKTDPLHGKQIFVSGRHECENLLIVDNDTDNNYAIISFGFNEKTKKIKCKTIEIIFTRKSLAEKLRNDHDRTVKQSKSK